CRILALLTRREATTLESAALLVRAGLSTGSLLRLGSTIHTTILGGSGNRLCRLDASGVVAVHSAVEIDRGENLKRLLLTAALGSQLVRTTLGRLSDNSASLTALVVNRTRTALTGSQSDDTSDSETSD